MLTKEILAYLATDEGKKALMDAGLFQTKEVIKEVPKEVIKEVVKEVPAQITDEEKSAIKAQYVRETLGLAEDANIENIKLVSADQVGEMKKGFINKIISNQVKHFDLIGSKIDYNKIELKDGAINGLDEQLEPLKASYPELFDLSAKDKKKSPPPGGDKDPDMKYTYEDFQKMSKEDRAKLTDDQLMDIMNS